MRVYAYVDGFNLYHGALEGTSHRWLDLRALLTKLLDDDDEIVRIKYFTARVSGNAGNAGSAGGPHRQDAYLRAVKAVDPSVEVILGKFKTRKVFRRRVDNGELVEVYNREEKGSDVNLAVHMVRDAFAGEFECAVVVSNDSDLKEPLRIVRDLGRMVGVIVPMAVPDRHVNTNLTDEADFHKKIRGGVCGDCQLPLSVTLPNGKVLTCPDRWSPPPAPAAPALPG